MSTISSNLSADDEATVVVRSCPRCKAANALTDLLLRDYRCGSCGFELAYLDVSTTGAVRGVVGWIHRDGDVIADRYRVTQVLGRGGFGATYLVQDLQLNGKRRALKEIPRDMFDEAEATLLARLDHASIPDIVDRLYVEQMVYLVLKFGGTRTLGSERKRLGGRIPLTTMAPWIHQLCRVLAYLHDQDPPIIHRDLKPDNILLDEQEHVMLIDFGIAKLATPNEETRTLGRAVSFGFSSPEQIMGTGTDQRSDVYSLGATVYYLLTGKHPPPLDAQLKGVKLESLSTQLPDIPRQVDQAVLKALDLNPERRGQSVRELLGVFEALERTLPHTVAVDVHSEHQRRNLMILASMLLGAALLGGGVALWRSGAEHDDGEKQAAPATNAAPAEADTEPTASDQADLAPPKEQATVAPPPAAPPATNPPEAVPHDEPSIVTPLDSEPARAAPIDKTTPAPRVSPDAKPPKDTAKPDAAKAKTRVTRPAPKPVIGKTEPKPRSKPQSAQPSEPPAVRPPAPRQSPPADWSNAMKRGQTLRTTP